MENKKTTAEHVDGILKCKWSQVDAQIINGALVAVYRCREPGSLREQQEQGFADVLCLNPDVVPCRLFAGVDSGDH